MAEYNKCWKRLSMKPEIEEEIAVILGYVQTGPVPNGSGPILERTTSVHTGSFRF